MKIEPFAVEQWMDAYETTAKYNIAETCCASVSIRDLVDLSETKPDAFSLLDVSAKQTYGHIRGDPELRRLLANLYSFRSKLDPENVLITPGAIAANFLVLHALVEAGDHVICHYPTYQQLYSVPQTAGAEVDLWEAKFENRWQLDVDELRSKIKSNTKLIILNNPQNPTGAAIKRSALVEIVQAAKEHNIIILADEVYRPLFHGIGPVDDEFPPSLLSMGYENVIVTGSLSKAYSLAGLRVGWIASQRRDLIELFEQARQYTTISVSQLDQAVAKFALSPGALHSLLGRNIQLAKSNLEILEAFIRKHSQYCEWVKPVAGTTAFVRFSRNGRPVNAVEFCKTLHSKLGVMFVPGDECFGKHFRGFVRIGFVPAADVIRDGLKELDNFMVEGFENIPTH